MISHFVRRALDQRPADWKYPRDREPVGVRLASGKAIAVFTWSTGLTGDDRIDLLHTANLAKEHVVELLDAMDVIAFAAGRKKGWAFGPAMGTTHRDVLFQAIAGMEDRFVSTARRAEVDGHLIGVAW